MSNMDKHLEAFQRLMKIVEGIPPEELQKILDRALAQVQLVSYLEEMAEKRKHCLTQAMTLVRMMRLGNTQNNHYANCPMMGVVF
jgi:hypothetical protein